MVSASMVKELRELTGAGMLDCKKALDEVNGNMEEAITYLREKGISKAQKKSSRIAAEGLALSKVNGNKAVIVEVNSETDFVAKNEEFIKLINAIADTLLGSNAKTVEEALELKYEDKTINDLIIEKISTIGEKLSLRRFEIVEKKDSEVFGTYSHLNGKIVTLDVLSSDEELAKDIAMQIAAMRPSYLSKEDVPSEVVEKERTILKETAVNEGLAENKIDMIVNGRLNKFYEEICLLEQAFVKNPDEKVSQVASKAGATVKMFIRYEVGEGIEKRQDNFAEEVMNQVRGNE